MLLPLIVFIVQTHAISGEELPLDEGVIVSDHKGKKYYHLNFTLDSENIASIDSLSEENFKLNGGQFELRINKKLFPISSPNCKLVLILRMPWTNPATEYSKSLIANKYHLYQSILEIKGRNIIGEGVNVIVELNPYVDIVDGIPILKNCNVFFRHSMGAYVPYIGKLK